MGEHAFLSSLFLSILFFQTTYFTPRTYPEAEQQLRQDNKLQDNSTSFLSSPICASFYSSDYTQFKTCRLGNCIHYSSTGRHHQGTSHQKQWLHVQEPLNKENTTVVCKSRKPKLSKKAIPYYSNSIATQRLLIVAGVELDPGPIRKRPKPTCAICSRTVAKTHRALDCSLCDNRIHIKCGNVSPKQYLSITATRPQTNWICQYCFHHSAFPFNNISDETFLELFPPGEYDNLTEPILNVDEYEDSLKWYKSNIGSYYRHNLKIAHPNINGILNKVDEVKEMLNRNMYVFSSSPKQRQITTSHRHS